MFLVRPDLEKLRAGDTIQIYSLKKVLEKMGFIIKISSERKPDLSGYDLVNCFNLLRVDAIGRQCSWVKEKGKPLIITPIYWNMEEYLRLQQPDLVNTWRYWQSQRKAVLQLADLVTPSAELELLQLKKDFQLDFPSRIIHNGVDPVFLQNNEQISGLNSGKNQGNNIAERKKLKHPSVLSVGRIHPQKNQHNLIRALKGSKLPLIIIGEINDPGYYKQCRREAEGENVTFLKPMHQNELTVYYHRARVHVLVSWFETPGLVNLEAGLAGCSLVTTDRGTTGEYLKDYALYCDPRDLACIRRNVLQAYRKKTDPAQITYIYQHFSWEKIAEKAAQSYRELTANFS